MKFRKLKIVTLIILAVIILVAAFLRFYNLDKWGPIFYDEGQYISEAYYTRDVLVWSANFITQIPFAPNKAEVIDQLVHQFDSSGQPLKTGRPVHNFLTAIGLFIFSGFNNPTNYILAIFGVINVLLAFILALLVTESKKVALIAPAFLAVLPLHVFYSRLSMAEMDSQFFFLLSLIFYILRIKKGKLIYWWLTSIAITLALVTNGDRFAFITPIIIELFLYRRQAIRQIFIFGLVFSVGMILSEIPYHIAFLLTHNYKIIIENPSYLEQQLWILARLTGFGLKINLLSFLSYPYMILNTTGYLFSIFWC